MSVHGAARGFETAADAYERGRPEYPPAALDRLCAALGLVPGARLLEVGAGTGKLTRLVASRGAEVVAVEPSAAMLFKVAGSRGANAVRALAEALPFRAGAFARAAAASSFHWFDGPSALAELHRVLRPGSPLGLLWNRRDEAGWVGRLSAIVNRHEGSAPRYRKGDWRRAFELAPGLFEPIEEARFPHVHRLTPDGVVDRVASISFIAALPAAERAGVLDEVRALLSSHPDTEGRPEIGLSYVTDLYLYVRR